VADLTIEDIGEEGIIEDIKRRFLSPVPLGIGDDAALIDPLSEYYMAITTDSFRENIHFRWDYFLPEDVGWKSVAVSISDIAAMGAEPQYLLLSFGIPEKTEYRIVQAMLQGVTEICHAYGVYLIGGNVSRSSGGLAIESVVIGKVERGREIRRDGARDKDLIYVTGELGRSAIGLDLLQKGVYHDKDHVFIRSHCRPRPRVREGKIFSACGIVTSMIDISDGLIKDLHHLCVTSKVSASINTGTIPCPSIDEDMVNLLSKDPLWYTLYGGEDYELLFTIPPERREMFESLCRQKDIKVTCIGEIIKGEENIIVDILSGKTFQIQGYDHFWRGEKG